MAVAFYLIIISLFVLLSYERAQRSHHAFAANVYLLSGAVGAIATAIYVLGGAVSPAMIIIFACVAACAASDLSCGLVYNSVLAAALALALALAPFGDALHMLLGGAVGFATAFATRKASRGGLGFGDVKLFGVVGITLGGIAVLQCFGSAFVAGAVMSIISLVTKRVTRSTPIPFSPYIAVATMTIGSFRLGFV